MSEVLSHPLFLVLVGFFLAQAAAFAVFLVRTSSTIKVLEANDTHLRELIELMKSRIERLEAKL